MFFILLLGIIFAFYATGHKPDEIGWMMLVGTAWLAGYLDCRFFKRLDRDTDRTMPPDMDPSLKDTSEFEEAPKAP